MDGIQEDIAYLNSQVLLLASDPDDGEQLLRLLGTHPNVAGRITAAGSKAVGTAIHCRVPLVTFSERMDSLLSSGSMELHGYQRMDVPDTLAGLTRITLQVAQRVALIDRTASQLHFGISHRAWEVLIGLSSSRLLRLERHHGVLLRLRVPEKVKVWDRLLIGDRCDGPRGVRISQQAALLALGME